MVDTAPAALDAAVRQALSDGKSHQVRITRRSEHWVATVDDQEVYNSARQPDLGIEFLPNKQH